MNKTTVGALLVVPVLVTSLMVGAAGRRVRPTASDHQILDYALAAEALVMNAAMNQSWLDLSKELYLVPNGFPADGTATFLQVPETSDLNASISGATDILVEAIQERWNADAFSADDPLYIFGYSQSNVAAGLAQQQLYDYGIPTGPLRFVMVGDSAAEGGFLSGFMDTLLAYVPEAWHADVIALVEEVARMLHVDSVMGLVTPDDLYPTDVYSLSSDGFGIWDGGQNTWGMFTDHLAYLGLTPEDIVGAQLDPTLGSELTRYFVIDAADVDMVQALMNSAAMIVDGLLALL